MKHEAFAARRAPARLDMPPRADQRAPLPADFGRRFVIFGDAEEEFDWNAPFARTNIATSAIASLPEATRRFNDHGAIPCYMVDYPVVDNPRSATILRAMADGDACDIGTQLHPWVNPPFDEDISDRNSFTGNLPRPLQRAKLHALTDRIEQATGQRPIIYRAGRYGIGEHTADLLIEAGYRLDVSVRALFDYRAAGGADFSHHPIWPWHVAGPLWEAPLTAAWLGGLRRFPGLHASPALRGPLARLGLLNRIALTPEDMPLPDVLEAIRILLGAGHRLFSLSFHTPSVEIGHTPYVRDAADLKRFWAWWDGVFALFAREGVAAIRGPEIVQALDRAGA
ncbi:WalW protein [Sphingobium boeckii]|uniref:Peptidoglycan/xylan/chitin deacetylase (PgdA/CDA1 family) n=1 Tax=Sphingobium boeckii TaxID=1082345 RepID=A0A7W9EGE2_9SPHN|nr:WalW protein [Sphingobium boeckii]MBB5687020.1 peptidoglycan/xylan/chitin deacetylase (PgdA/CDA1 family) [Sphingobium boeckii]